MAQAMHAALNFTHAHPEMIFNWIEHSNYLVVVNTPDEVSLCKLAAQADEAGILSYSFTEPDMGDQLTAVAFQPGPEARRICSRLPLALRDTKQGTRKPDSGGSTQIVDPDMSTNGPTLDERTEVVQP